MSEKGDMEAMRPALETFVLDRVAQSLGQTRRRELGEWMAGERSFRTLSPTAAFIAAQLLKSGHGPDGEEAA